MRSCVVVVWKSGLEVLWERFGDNVRTVWGGRALSTDHLMLPGLDLSDASFRRFCISKDINGPRCRRCTNHASPFAESSMAISIDLNNIDPATTISHTVLRDNNHHSPLTTLGSRSLR